MKSSALEVSAPHPEILLKLRDKYRFSVSIKAEVPKEALRVIKQTMKNLKKKKDVIVSINVDP